MNSSSFRHIRKFLHALCPSRGLSFIPLFVSVFFLSGPASAQQGDRVTEETKYVMELNRWGFKDYAVRVADALQKTAGSGDGRVQLLDVKMKIHQKKFAEAKAILEGMDTSKFDAWGTILDAADTYFVYGAWEDTEYWYDKLMRAFPEPSAQYAQFCRTAAYKYSQMLKSMKKDEKALLVYEYGLKTKPEDAELGQMLIEMGQICLKVAMRSPQDSAERNKWLGRAKEYAEKVQWMGWERVPVWFGKSVVIYAQIAQLQGKKKDAWGIIGDYEQILGQIHAELERAAKEEKDNDILRITPMAECKFLKGAIIQDEAMDMLKQGKTREGKIYLKMALDELFPVFVLYPTTAWAPQAGKRVQDIFDEFDRLGVKYKTPPNFTLVEVVKVQLAEARLYMRSGGFDDAVDKFIEILSLFPEFPGQSMLAVADTAECLYRSKQFDAGDAVAGYLSERHKKHPNVKLSREAGDALMYLGKMRKDAADADSAIKIFSMLINDFTNHPQRGLITLFLGDMYRERGDTEKSIETLKLVVPKAEEYSQALNSISFAYKRMGDPTNELATLKQYLAVVKKGKDAVMGQYRLGVAYLALNDPKNAATAFNTVVRMIGLPEYNATPVDKSENEKMLEAALFNTAAACAKVKDDPRTADYQKKAIEMFGEYVTKFPEAPAAPGALMRKGIMETILKQTKEAAETFKLLEKNYPKSEERTQMYYLNIKILLEMGQVAEAKTSVKQLLENASKYSEGQFATVAKMLIENNEGELAIKCYEQAMTGAKDPVKDRFILEAGNYELGRYFFGQGKYAEAAQYFDKLFTMYPRTGYTIDASFMQSKALVEIGAKISDRKERVEVFNKAMGSLNKVTKLIGSDQFKERDAELRPRISYEIAQIYEARVRIADVSDSTNEAATARGNANAAYLRLFHNFDHQKAQSRPYIEEAFKRLIPYEMAGAAADPARYRDVVEFCEKYLQNFPKGKYVKEAQDWMAEAKPKADALPPEEEMEEEDGSAAPSAAAPKPAAAAPKPAAAAPKPAAPAPAAAKPAATAVNTNTISAKAGPPAGGKQ